MVICFSLSVVLENAVLVVLRQSLTTGPDTTLVVFWIGLPSPRALCEDVHLSNEENVFVFLWKSILCFTILVFNLLGYYYYFISILDW